MEVGASPLPCYRAYMTGEQGIDAYASSRLPYAATPPPHVRANAQGREVPAHAPRASCPAHD
ncbi:hypothetical protein BC834DRAFT_877391 [Gloeopeniophorella convolvens]|nr:hypothetical protein BC834DRAFT_877391 [Gloeopeniophorella convolvens]